MTSYGRANKPGESIFYCCSSRRAPFFELGCVPGDEIAMSTWRTSPRLTLNHIGFTEEAKERLGSNRDLESIYDFVTATNNFNSLNEMVHEYIAYIFSRPIENDIQQNYYKLTSKIAQHMMNADFLHGLMYPTIQMAGNADNIALKKSYFENYVSIVNVEYIRIDEMREMEYDITVMDSATSFDPTGEINWSGRPLKWQLKFGQEAVVRVEDGRWVAEDKDGRRIDPC